MQTLEDRIEACEREHQRLRKRVARQNNCWLIALMLATGGGALAGGSLKEVVFDSVKAKEVVVVDAHGIVRARLGGDLPDAVMAGGRVSKRGEKVAGLMLYDDEGIERGGYITGDKEKNIMLSLDSKYRQSTWFIAGPTDDQTSSLRMWTSEGALELRSDTSGQRLQVSDKTGVRFQQPVVALKPSTCTYYKELERKYPGERTCAAKFTEAACQACFDSQ